MREEYKLRVSEKRVLNIFGPKRGNTGHGENYIISPPV
jgi:hypothetical protein